MNGLPNIAGIEELTDKQIYAIKLLVDYEQDLTYKEIADKVGVHEKTLYNWRKNDETFVEVKKQAAEAGLKEKIDKVNRILLEGAIDGDPRLIKLYYERIGEYRDRKEITGKDGEPIKTEQTYDLSELTDEELRLLEEINKKVKS